MVMFTATIFAERSLALNSRFAGLSFCHVGHPIGKEYVQDYLRLADTPQVPVKIVSCTPLQQESPLGVSEASWRSKEKRSLCELIWAVNNLQLSRKERQKQSFPSRRPGRNFRTFRDI